MQSDPAQRRLAAIVAIDVAGYARLTNRDEEGTHRRLMQLMRELVTPVIAEHRGRVVKWTGDGAIAEFASATDAMRSALIIQERNHELAADDSDDNRIVFRIGINLGDVIVDGSELYGDGVNIAVRLESIAEPGTIMVSHVVADQVRDRLPLTLVDLGEEPLKNIERPVRIFLAAGEFAVRSERSHEAPKPILRPSVGAGPVIAVLPFINMGPGSEHDYFADGLTEDLITALAGWRSFPVIARNSVFAFRGRNVDIRQVGRALRAQYVLEGSIRCEGKRVRATAQLIEVETNVHVFAGRYDRALDDVFAIQDEIVNTMVGALEPELLRVESQRAMRSPTRFAAYDHLLRGIWYHHRYTDEDNISAQHSFEESLRIDPNYAQAAAALATSRIHRVMHGWSPRNETLLASALEWAQHAIVLDPKAPQSHFALGLCHLHAGRIEMARREMEAVIELHPSHAVAWVNLGNIRNYLDQPARALECVQTAHRLSPHDPRHFLSIPALAGSFYLLGRYQEAIDAGRQGHVLKPDYVAPLRYVAAALGQLGRCDEAAPAVAMVRESDGDVVGTEKYLRRYYVADSAIERIIQGLRKAGMD
jgi:adenylate cyclase